MGALSASDALESVIFPLLKSFTHKPLSFSYHRFPDENQVEELLCALQNFNTKAGNMTGEFLAELMQKLDVLITKSTEHFFSLESEVSQFYFKESAFLFYNSINWLNLIWFMIHRFSLLLAIAGAMKCN